MTAQVLVVVAEGESMFELLQSDLFTKLLNLLITLFLVLCPFCQGVLQGGGVHMRGVLRGGGAYEGGTAGVGVHMRGVLRGWGCI